MLRLALAGLVIVAVAGMLAAAFLMMARALVGVALMAFSVSFFCLMVKALSKAPPPRAASQK